MQIGSYTLANNVIAAPMAGVSDLPYREVCRQFGAAMAVSEMVTSKIDLRHTTKTKFRLKFANEPKPRAIQIVGTEPEQLAKAAQFNVRHGAQIIDINMGCPAKKVCQKAAGSALLADEPLVNKILTTVAKSVDVPVTVKIRTGADPQNRNGVTIAKIAEDAGIAAITVHGRTRACRFVGAVEYDTIAAIKHAVSIPVIANGDIDSPQRANRVLTQTGADAIMIGRAAQGQPWLFQQVVEYLETGHVTSPPSIEKRAEVILDHMEKIHRFYGERLGIRFARKHLKWYLSHWDQPINPVFLSKALTAETADEQLDALVRAAPELFQPSTRLVA